MTDTNSTPSGSDELRAVVTSTGSAPQIPEGIPEDDQPYAQRIMGMDPIKDVPGNATMPEGRRLAPMKLEALSPEMQQDVRDQLDKLPPSMRESEEPRLVRERAEGELSRIRLMTGLGKSALPYHKEMVSVAREYRDLAREWNRYNDDLNRVSGYTTTTDPQTGDAIPEEVHTIGGVRRTHYENHMRDLERRMRLLVNEDGKPGIEAQNRTREALKESIALIKRHESEAAIQADIQRRAAEINREKRVEDQAQLLARIQRNGVNC